LNYGRYFEGNSGRAAYGKAHLSILSDLILRVIGVGARSLLKMGRIRLLSIFFVGKGVLLDHRSILVQLDRLVEVDLRYRYIFVIFINGVEKRLIIHHW